jgi:hypothetical protein
MISKRADIVNGFSVQTISIGHDPDTSGELATGMMNSGSYAEHERDG